MGEKKRLAKPISLSIDYEDADGDRTTRDIRIMAVGTSRHGVYFEAWCMTREETRTFRIDRIMSIIDPDGVVLDPAPEIGRVLLEAQNAKRSVLGQTKHQREMDKVSAGARAAREPTQRGRPNPQSEPAGTPSATTGLIILAAIIFPFFYVDGFWNAVMVSVGTLIAVGLLVSILKR